MSLIKRLLRFAADDNGQDLLEYGLLVTLLVLVAIAAVTGVGVHVDSMFGDIASKVPS